MPFTVTVRHGTSALRYITIDVDRTDLREALRAVADALPDEVAADADLLELRRTRDPEEREFLEEGGAGGEVG